MDSRGYRLSAARGFALWLLALLIWPVAAFASYGQMKISLGPAAAVVGGILGLLPFLLEWIASRVALLRSWGLLISFGSLLLAIGWRSLITARAERDAAVGLVVVAGAMMIALIAANLDQRWQRTALVIGSGLVIGASFLSSRFTDWTWMLAGATVVWSVATFLRGDR